MIKVNSDTFRFVYNQAVRINNKLYKLKQDETKKEKAKEIKEKTVYVLSITLFFLFKR